jgi:hypothetical protein
VRRTGRLTFADVQRLLLPAAGGLRLAAERKPAGDEDADARLFREIFEHYNHGGSGAIQEERLDRSFRSGPPSSPCLRRRRIRATDWRGSICA